MSMTEEEAYQCGLGKLGLETRCRLVTSPLITGECLHGWSSEHDNDLRTDPAFAWQVLTTFKQAGLVRNTANPKIGWHFVGTNVQTPDFWYANAADALYAAVCELGRQGC